MHGFPLDINLISPMNHGFLTINLKQRDYPRFHTSVRCTFFNLSYANHTVNKTLRYGIFTCIRNIHKIKMA